MYLLQWVSRKIFQWLLWVFLLGILLIGCGSERERHTLIESDPPGAKVFLDDQFLGITPLGYKYREEPSSHPRKFQLVLEGYYEYQRTTVLSNLHHFDLVPYEQDIEVKFSPSPDLLFVDNRSLPPEKRVRLTLPLGLHRFLAYKKGFPFLEKEIHIKNVPFSEVQWAFSTKQYRNRLTISGVPDEVEVYYKDHFLGTTPLVWQNLAEDPLSLVFRKEGYEEKNIILQLYKGENRAIIARLNPIMKPRRLIWENIPPNSQIILNGDNLAPVYRPGEGGSHAVLLVTPEQGNYRYTVSHPDYYRIQGEVVLSNSELKIPLTPVLKIPSHPKKILEASLPAYDTVREEGGFFFLSIFGESRIQVYDSSFNLIHTFDLSKVGRQNSPRIMTGFSYPGPFLLHNRIITADRSFSFLAENTGLIEPVYLLPFTVDSEEGVMVFDNGDHRIKFFSLEESRPSFSVVTAREYFSVPDPGDAVKREYLLPLRFAQAIEFSPSNHSQRKKVLFTDVVNRDIKVYDPVSGVAEYFLSSFESQPDNPQALASYHDLILAADAVQGKVWVYDREGRFIHDFNLAGTGPRYLFTVGRRLYALGEKISIYFLE